MSSTGIWMNQRGSIMALREEPFGQIPGKYRVEWGRVPRKLRMASNSSGTPQRSTPKPCARA